MRILSTPFHPADEPLRIRDLDIPIGRDPSRPRRAGLTAREMAWGDALDAECARIDAEYLADVRPPVDRVNAAFARMDLDTVDALLPMVDAVKNAATIRANRAMSAWNRANPRPYGDDP